MQLYSKKPKVAEKITKSYGYGKETRGSMMQKIFHLQKHPVSDSPRSLSKKAVSVGCLRPSQPTTVLRSVSYHLCISSLSLTLIYCNRVPIFIFRMCYMSGFNVTSELCSVMWGCGKTNFHMRDYTPTVPLHHCYTHTLLFSISMLVCKRPQDRYISRRVNFIIYCFLIYRNAAAGMNWVKR